MTYLCRASNTTKFANGRPICTDPQERAPRYETGDCMDCLHTFELTEDPSPKSDRQVLPVHFEDGTLLETVVKEALVPTITAEVAARHLAAIRKAAKS